jgi:hypothetical protein
MVYFDRRCATSRCTTTPDRRRAVAIRPASPARATDVLAEVDADVRRRHAGGAASPGLELTLAAGLDEQESSRGSTRRPQRPGGGGSEPGPGPHHRRDGRPRSVPRHANQRRATRRPKQSSAPATPRCRSSSTERSTDGTQPDCSDREGALISGPQGARCVTPIGTRTDVRSRNEPVDKLDAPTVSAPAGPEAIPRLSSLAKLEEAVHGCGHSSGESR